ncbi:MAG: RDD family protein [Myxococcaceae bacterium]
MRPAEAWPATPRPAPILDEPTEPGPALVAPRRRPSVELPAEVLELHARPAPLWRRLGAWVVDLAVQGALTAGAGAAALLSGRLTSTTLPDTNLSGLDLFMLRLHSFQHLLLPAAALLVFAVFVYSTLFAKVWSGRSPGRLLFGIRLVDARGLPPSAGRALMRSAFSLVSFALLLGGFWVSLFDRRGQTLHDRLTSTFVVRPS